MSNRRMLFTGLIAPPPPPPYIRGREGSIRVWLDSRAYDYIAVRPYDYDKNVQLGPNDGSYKTYKTIVVGDYEWMVDNLFIEYVNRMGTALAWANLTQPAIDQMNQSYQVQNNVSLDKFNKINGSYVGSYDTASSFRKSFKVYDPTNGNLLDGWDLPYYVDFLSLMGLAPQSKPTVFENVSDFLFASQSDVGDDYRADWFKSLNISGLGFTPLGRRHSNFEGVGGQTYMGYKVESSFRMKDYTVGQMVFDWTMGIALYTNLYHFGQARYCRRLSDGELGYKLYVAADNDMVLCVAATETLPYPLLSHGCERGIATRYLDKNKMTVRSSWSQIQAEASAITSAISVY